MKTHVYSFYTNVKINLLNEKQEKLNFWLWYSTLNGQFKAETINAD